MDKRIFLTVQDLMFLLGCSYRHAWENHKTIRVAKKRKSKLLTIKEYCDFEGFEFDEIWKALRE